MDSVWIAVVCVNYTVLDFHFQNALLTPLAVIAAQVSTCGGKLLVLSCSFFLSSTVCMCTTCDVDIVRHQLMGVKVFTKEELKLVYSRLTAQSVEKSS